MAGKRINIGPNWLGSQVIFEQDQSETVSRVQRFLSVSNSIVLFHDIDFMQYIDSGVLSIFFPKMHLLLCD